MRFNRRQLLWFGLGGTSAGALGKAFWQGQRQQQAAAAEQAKLRELYDPDTLAQTAFRSDLTAIEDLITVQQSAQLRSPTHPYDRNWSKRLIVASKLSTQQYLYGKYNADYDGRISVLPLYANGFTDFQQVTAFKAPERAQERIQFEVPLADLASTGKDLSALPKRLDQTQDSISRQVKQAVQLIQKIPVYYGFLLTSPSAHLMIFRGTQRQAEWIKNVLAFQDDYLDPNTQTPIGQVHFGFHDFYNTYFAPLVKDAVKSLDPSKPLLVSGHSLGASLAALAAMDLALNLPALRSSLRVYTYGGPRLGNRAFVEAHSRLIPNHYRVVNLADVFPMLPLSKLATDEFVHAGEQWSFLSHQGDIMPNHIVETYRQAIEQGAETRGDAGFANLRLKPT